MGLVGRRLDQGVNCRLAEWRRFSGGRLEINQLRGGVIIEQVFIVGCSEEILERWRGTCVADALLHMRTDGDGRLDWSGPAGSGNRTDDQRAIVAQPLERGRAADLDPIHVDAGDSARMARGWRRDP